MTHEACQKSFHKSSGGGEDPKIRTFDQILPIKLYDIVYFVILHYRS